MNEGSVDRRRRRAARRRSAMLWLAGLVFFVLILAGLTALSAGAGEALSVWAQRLGQRPHPGGGSLAWYEVRAAPTGISAAEYKRRGVVANVVCSLPAGAGDFLMPGLSLGRLLPDSGAPRQIGFWVVVASDHAPPRLDCYGEFVSWAS